MATIILHFLSRLCGGEHHASTVERTREFLSRLCGGEPNRLQ